MLSVKPLDVSAQYETVKALFEAVFSAPPWNDDWSDQENLKEYLLDIFETRSPLHFGLYDGETLIGFSLGFVKHWWNGLTYHLEEFGIACERQHEGLGSFFIREIEKQLSDRQISRLFLSTERGFPSFRFYLRCGFHELSDLVNLVKKVSRP